MFIKKKIKCVNDNIKYKCIFFNGVFVWLMIRISAIFILFYVLYILFFLFFLNIVTYNVYELFFSKCINKVYTVFFLFCVLYHSYIGMWQVITDYVKDCFFQLIIQYIILMVSIFYFLIGVILLIGV